MRTVLRAERAYKKKHGKYATSLAELAGTASFTKRWRTRLIAEITRLRSGITKRRTAMSKDLC